MHRTSHADKDRTSVPKVSLVFRVGVVGHRPNRLQSADLEALAGQVRGILHVVRHAVLKHHQANPALYDEATPTVRAVSPLAEGVDRLFADQALAEQYELNVVLPFAQAEFENDFTGPHALEPNSVQRFQSLLQRAKTVFELDGARSESARAYKVAGDVVLNQSDLLIVVWDGARKNLRGGTEETFDDAVERGVPVVWIDAQAPHPWQMVTQPLRSLETAAPQGRASPAKTDDPDQLQRHVRRLLALSPPPQPQKSSRNHHAAHREDPRATLETYYAEKRPQRNWAICWKWFRNVVGDLNFEPPRVNVEPYEEAVCRNWPRDRSKPIAAMIDRLRPFYAWADKTADRFADAYRSTFVVAYFFAALAVAMALGPIGLGLRSHSGGEIAFAVAEFVAIGLILVIVVRGRIAEWHRRWLDYRLLAELIRHQRLVTTLGGQRAMPSVPEHWASYGNPAASWMAWYARALERSLGLPHATVDRDYLQGCLNDLRDQLKGQIDFHHTTSKRCDRIEHRLHFIEVLLLVATLICCVLHITQGFWHDWLPIPGHGLTFCCGTFPALGAALAGINNQGEFKRIARRSESMHEQLTLQLEAIASLEQKLSAAGSEQQQLSADIAQVSGRIAQTMVNEVLDWRVIFQDRPLNTT